MKAIVYHNNGSGDVLKLEEIENPVPRDDEVLVKVRGLSVNPFDCHMLRHSWLRRILARLAKIETNRPGRDVAGTRGLPIADCGMVIGEPNDHWRSKISNRQCPVPTRYPDGSGY